MTAGNSSQGFPIVGAIVGSVFGVLLLLIIVATIIIVTFLLKGLVCNIQHAYMSLGYYFNFHCM